MTKKIFFVFLMLCVGISARADSRKSGQHVVSGYVCDEDHQPLVGATITVLGHNHLGTTTDLNGHYVIGVPDAETKLTLRASFVGYVAQSKRLSLDKNQPRNFYLQEDQQLLGEVVVTGTRTPKLLKDAPIVTRVITMDDIQKVDATHIGDLLESELPGIEFSYSMNQQVSLNMQGFGGNAVLFLVDGERVAGETLDNIDYNRLNLDNVERIEIVKGAASSLYGSNAVGGVVNLITKSVTRPWTLNANGRWGAHGEQRYGVSAGFKKGRVSNNLTGQYYQIGEIRLKGDGDYGKVYANRNYNIKDQLVYKPIDDLKITAKAGFFFRERDSQKMLKERYRSFNGGLKGNYHVGEKGDLELSYTFDQYDKSDYGLTSKLDVRDYSNVQHTTRALYNHAFNKDNILTVGGDYMRDYLMSYQFEDGGAHFQHTFDVFAQYDWNIVKNLNLIAGLRYDFFSDAQMQHLSPKLGLMYKIGDCSLRGSYAGGFRAPTLKEMYMSFNMANIFMIYGNPDLKPESSDNFSLSAEYSRGNYNVTATGFYNLVDNRITTAWNREREGMVYMNMAQLKIGGIDFSACAKYACGISARVSYVYTHEYIKKGQPLTSSTRPHTATARLEYGRNWKNYGFNVALHGRVLSKVTTDVYTSSTSYEETVKETYPAYTMWKLSLVQNIWKGINVNVTVDNLFNYVPKYYYNNSPSTTGTTCSVGVSLDIDRMFK